MSGESPPSAPAGGEDPPGSAPGQIPPTRAPAAPAPAESAPRRSVFDRPAFDRPAFDSTAAGRRGSPSAPAGPDIAPSPATEHVSPTNNPASTAHPEEPAHRSIFDRPNGQAHFTPARALPTSAYVPRRRWISRGLLALGVLLLLSAGWVGWRTYQAYRHLNAAVEQVSSLQEQVKNLDHIDTDKANAAVASLQAEAGAAADATSDPLYRLAGHLPWIGRNLRAISEIAGTVDGLATAAAPSLLQAARTVQPSALAPRNGTVDVGPIAKASPGLQAADAQVTSAAARMAAVDREPLAGSVAAAVESLQAKLTTLQGTTGTAAMIGRLAPPLLGVGGTRHYLVVFQNLAEPRSTGGIFGSYALLNVTKGKIQLVGQGSGSRDLGTFDPPLPVPPALPKALYGDLPGRHATDVNLAPDFPVAAQLISTMYTARRQVQLDGVLALDPVALSYLLVDAKPIDVGQGISLDSANITDTLLSKAYFLYPDAAQAPARDRFLSSAVAKAFESVMSSPGSAGSTLSGLKKGALEHRILLWSADPAEQKDLATTNLAGTLPTTDGAVPTVGVFRNDGTGGKLGYYASGSAALAAGSCGQDGSRNLTLTVRLGYSAPASGLPPYVLGLAHAGPYVLRTNLLILAPVTGDLTALSVDGRPVAVVWATESGRKVGMIMVDLQPGTSAVVTGSLTVSAPAGGTPRFTPAVWLTPGVTNWDSAAEPFDAC